MFDMIPVSGLLPATACVCQHLTGGVGRGHYLGGGYIKYGLISNTRNQNYELQVYPESDS